VTSWYPTFLTLSRLAGGTLTPKGSDGGLAAEAEGIDGISFGDTQNITADPFPGLCLVVQRVLGPATAAMTMDLYGQLVDGNLRQAARLVGDTSGTFEPPDHQTRAPTSRRRTEVPGESGYLGGGAAYRN
jgi:hypothetical protein